VNVDRALVTKAIQTGGIVTLLSRGVSGHLFSRTPDGQECCEVFEWMSDHARRYNAPPSPQLFRDRFPAWQGEPSSDSLDALIDSFRGHVKRRAFSAKIVELAKYEYDPSRWHELDQLMLDAARDLSALVPEGTVGRFSEMQQRITQYEEERRNPELRRSLRMGIPPFDDITNGMRPGNLVTIAGFSGLGKALDLETPVPTPVGWTTMGEITPGQQVFGSDGRSTEVVWVGDVLLNRPCYEVVFSDGATVVADAEHLWATSRWNARGSEARAQRKEGNRVAPWNDQTHKRVLPGTVTTQELYDELQRDSRKHSVPCAGPVQYAHSDVPIDPYVFGYWLGDGTSGVAEITVGVDDLPYLVEHLGAARISYNVKVDPKKPTTRRVHFGSLATCHCGHSSRDRHGNCRECQKLQNHSAYWGTELSPLTHFTAQEYLRHLGVLGNKHIPDEYLRASVAQRLELLRGIMDSDGEVRADRWCDICVTNEILARDILDLALGLGIKATFRAGVAKLHGRVIGPKYNVGFSTDLDVASLPRKRVRLSASISNRAKIRYIVDVRPVESRPVRCISVTADDHQFLVGRSYIPTHNSLLSQVLVMNAVEAQDATGLILSLEMTKEEIFERLDTMVTKFSYKLLGKRDLPEQDVALWRRIANQFAAARNEIYVKDRMLGCTPDRVYAEINRYKPDIAVVDYVQLMRTQRRSDAQWQTLVEVTNSLKEIALATDCVIVMVSQDGRGAAQDGSTDQNMGGSISVYQAADIYLGLHQSDEMYAQERMEVRLLKARRGERKHKAYLTWQPATMTVEYREDAEISAEDFMKAAA
jgi:replicative DNA helicase